MNIFYTTLAALAVILVFWTLFYERRLGRRIPLGSFYILDKLNPKRINKPSWRQILLLLLRLGVALPLALLLFDPIDYDAPPQQHYLASSRAAEADSQATLVELDLPNKAKDSFDQGALFLKALQQSLSPESFPARQKANKTTTAQTPKPKRKTLIVYGSKATSLKQLQAKFSPNNSQGKLESIILLPRWGQPLKLPTEIEPKISVQGLSKKPDKVGQEDIEVQAHYHLKSESDSQASPPVKILDRLNNNHPLALSWSQQINGESVDILLWAAGISTRWGQLGTSGYMLEIIKLFLGGKGELSKDVFESSSSPATVIRQKINSEFWLKLAALFLLIEALWFAGGRYVRQKELIPRFFWSRSGKGAVFLFAVLFFISPQQNLYAFSFQELSQGGGNARLFAIIRKQIERRTSILFDKPPHRLISAQDFNRSYPTSPALWLMDCSGQRALQRIDQGRLVTFLQKGGMIIADGCSRKQSPDNFNYLDGLARRINPEHSGLRKISHDHSLYRSFYLLPHFEIWGSNISQTTQRTAILFINHPLKNQALRQKETAIRSYINIIMFLLSGNYKKDQIHTRHILKRIKKRELFR